jgi:prepilin-type N-terminal cleavage/methylation domain-containing protein
VNLIPRTHSAQGKKRCGNRGGFTLLELMVIVVIMAILASSVIPMMDQSVQARQGASRDEVVRYFEYARGRAIAGGIPAGVFVDTTNSTLRVVTLNDAGSIVDLADPIDGGIKEVDMGELFAGVSIGSFVNGDGVSGSGTVWFDFQAESHTRDSISGAFDAVFTQNATVTLSTGTLIVIHAGSGLVEER